MQEQIKRGRGRPIGKTVSNITATLSGSLILKLSKLSLDDRQALIIRAIDIMDTLPVGRKKREIGTRVCKTVTYTVNFSCAEKYMSLKSRSFRLEEALQSLLE